MGAARTTPSNGNGQANDTLDPAQRAAFETVRKEGYVLLPDALSSAQCERYTKLMYDVAKRHKTYVGEYLRASDLISAEFGFTELLDYPATYPIAKALLGGYARIMSSEAIIRTDVGDDPVRWHEDGPNCPSYRSLAVPCPTMQVKIGYFLNDLETEQQGNLVVIPRSHLRPTGPTPGLPHGTDADGAVAVKAKAGTAIIFHSAVWHCVQPNRTKTPRRSLYFGYCLPWMAPFDRSAANLALKGLLTGERRNLLMDHEHPGLNYSLFKQTWRGDPKLAAAGHLRIGYELAMIRLKRLKRAILGNSVN